MEAFINFSMTGHKSRRLYKISSSLILNPILILLVLAFLFLPMESTFVRGYFHMPPLDIREFWILIPITLSLMLIGNLLAKYNRKTLHGKLLLNYDKVEIQLRESTEQFPADELEYIELTGDKELYILTKSKKSFNLQIENFQDLNSLRTVLDYLTTKTEVVQR